MLPRPLTARRFIETSAAHVNVADTARVTTASTIGLAGTWLIDPFDYTSPPRAAT